MQCFPPPFKKRLKKYIKSSEEESIAQTGQCSPAWKGRAEVVHNHEGPVSHGVKSGGEENFFKGGMFSCDN